MRCVTLMLRFAIKFLLNNAGAFRQDLVIPLPIFPIMWGSGPWLLITRLAGPLPGFLFQRVGTSLVPTAIQSFSRQIFARVHRQLLHPLLLLSRDPAAGSHFGSLFVNQRLAHPALAVC